MLENAEKMLENAVQHLKMTRNTLKLLDIAVKHQKMCLKLSKFSQISLLICIYECGEN